MFPLETYNVQIFFFWINYVNASFTTPIFSIRAVFRKLYVHMRNFFLNSSLSLGELLAQIKLELSVNRKVSENQIIAAVMRLQVLDAQFSMGFLWWHTSAITCQIIMFTCQNFMSSCQIFMLAYQIFMLTCHLK